MHQPVLDYIAGIKNRFPKHFKDARVLELGSKDINGTPREFFTNCEYIGVDQVGGEGVEHVGNAHEYNNGEFDTVLTTEMLEHDSWAEASLKNAKSILKPGGLLIATAAGVGREKHYGIHKCETYYKNITKRFVLDIFPDAEIDIKNKDIRFIWQKSTQP